ncbi:MULTISPECIES: tyrosine-type recombinase/integrase [Alteribacter]|uniref:Site-specific integrase n=1 Tax=Alteribacter keqinensis TaxID=2483800 RepID=A0A3M7TRX6_9BACI|nr:MULTISPECIES: tyrosine-type recombinase/integrase [Alteribacter]MBM7095305.1 tyrosine-type recombinase/integrase [Alteribacter salitolerans]RNA67050.1 site-specific integrase [Alteribacter keqinensis]
MEYVEPIKDISKINEIKEILKKQSPRDYALFTLGINTGLRISEILSIKLSDISDSSGSINEFFSYTENEKAYCHFYLNKQVHEALHLYLSSRDLKPGDYLFKSAKGDFPLSRQQAYRIIHQAAREAGITNKIGTHTLRKTFGYHAYQKGVAISLLQKILNHTSKKKTYEYLGIDPEQQAPLKIDVNL